MSAYKCEAAVITVDLCCLGNLGAHVSESGDVNRGNRSCSIVSRQVRAGHTVIGRHIGALLIDFATSKEQWVRLLFFYGI